MRAGSRIRVWCEDRQHESFVRALLESRGVHRRSVFVSISPKGKGSASQWVIDQYRELQAEARASKNQANLGFLLIVDGDNQGPHKRFAQIHGGIDGRSQTDRVAIFVPTWNVETWVLWLSGSDTDEAISHKGELAPARFRDLLSVAIRGWAVARPYEEEKVPSLVAGKKEMSRLPL